MLVIVWVRVTRFFNNSLAWLKEYLRFFSIVCFVVSIIHKKCDHLGIVFLISIHGG